ncbi:MAG TPA: hypothetical protein VF808_15950 [Ktedonobacterales bacterium]
MSSPRALAPMTLGTNLALYDTNDQVVNDAGAQRALLRMGVPIVRMPFRAFLPDAFELRALWVIRSLGAIPLVIVHGPADAQALADDRHAIELVQQVFGRSEVYVEFGNEPDLAGYSASAYTASWNQVVPALKAMAPTYKFAGPVTFQADPAYVAYFDQYAVPRPDVNTWHEYVCYPYSADAYCLQHLANWGAHIQATNTAVAAAIGAPLPVMITEWNLDATHDARYANSAFMEQWVAAAAHELATDRTFGLVAAMQYCASNNSDLSLIGATGAATPEGQVFQVVASGA